VSLFSIRVFSSSFVVKNKNPTAGWQWGPIKLVNQSEPDRRAAQQQRVQQQIQIQIAIHSRKLTIRPGRVKWFFAPASADIGLPCKKNHDIQAAPA